MADKWLKKRQEELSTLSFRCYDGDLFPEQKKLIREAGYYVYDLRDWDDGSGYNIELSVVVNHIGCWVTDIDLKPYMNNTCGHWIGIDELEKASIHYTLDEILKPYLEEGRKQHFNK